VSATDTTSSDGRGRKKSLFDLQKLDKYVPMFAPETHYGVKVPILSEDNFGLKVPGRLSEVLQFAFFGKVGAVLYRLDSNGSSGGGLRYRVFIFSAESEIFSNAAREELSFAASQRAERMAKGGAAVAMHDSISDTESNAFGPVASGGSQQELDDLTLRDAVVDDDAPPPPPMRSIPKLKIELPCPPHLAHGAPRICLHRHTLWAADELNLYAFSTKTGQLLTKHRHGLDMSEAPRRGMGGGVKDISIQSVAGVSKSVMALVCGDKVAMMWVP
jgi:hypothetical protein